MGDQNASTMVRIFPLGFKLDITTALNMIPVSLSIPVRSKPRAKKIEPSLTPIGTAISARLKPYTIGIPGGFFNSTVMIMLSVGDSYVTIRFSEDKLHVCGIKSDIFLDSFVYYSLNLLKQGQRNLDMFHEHFLEMRDLAFWFYGKCEGPMPHPHLEITQHLVKRFIYPHTTDTFYSLLVSLSNTTNLYEGILHVTEFQFSMTNYNCHIGQEIDIFSLGRFFGFFIDETGLIPRYDNSQQMLIVEKVCEGRATKRKKSPSVSFIVRNSGHVKISGPEINTIAPVAESFQGLVQRFLSEENIDNELVYR